MVCLLHLILKALMFLVRYVVYLVDRHCACHLLTSGNCSGGVRSMLATEVTPTEVASITPRLNDNPPALSLPNGRLTCTKTNTLCLRVCRRSNVRDRHPEVYLDALR